MRTSYLKYCMLAASTLVMMACGEAPTKTSLEQADTADTATADTTEPYNIANDGEYATQYTVVIDTSYNYYTLQTRMYALSQQTAIVVDTLERYYNAEKDDIVYPDDHEDETFRGAYYPRRADGCALSIEHYNWYDTSQKDDKIKVLVVGQYENKASADSLLTAIKQHAPNAYIQAAWVFMGCMH